MKVFFTDDEMSRLEALQLAYDKLIKEAEAKELELSPGSVPDVSYLQEKRPSLPTPISNDVNGNPIYDAEELKKYQAENQAIDDQITEIYNAWAASGSDEWREVKKLIPRYIEQLAAQRNDLYEEAEARQFRALGDSIPVIVADAKQQIDWYIEDHYKYYLEEITNGMVSAHDVRVDENTGNWYLDPKKIKTQLEKAVIRLHFEALSNNAEATAELDDYIRIAIENSPYISKTGKLGGQLRTYGAKSSISVIRPASFVTTVDKTSSLLFDNEIEIEKIDEDGSYNVTSITLSSKRSRKNPVKQFASINYDAVLNNGYFSKVPTLNDFDRLVYDGIITNLDSGNRTMSVDMIYRAMTGKVDGDVDVSDAIRDRIVEALHKFKADLRIEYDKEVLIGNRQEKATFNHREPLVMYRENWVEINGKTVFAITIPNDVDSDPILLRWARFNGNEIDTRDIRLLNVKGLNNGEESVVIKMALYRRIISMYNDYKKATISKKPMKLNRKIAFDYIYDKLGLDNPTPVKKQRVKERIEKCLDFWVDGGLITGYTFYKAKGSNKFAGVEINFLKQLED